MFTTQSFPLLQRFVFKHYFYQVEEYEKFFSSRDPKVLRNEVFAAAFNKVDLKKSPGSPLVYQHPTNATLPNIYGEMKQVLEERLSRLETLGKAVFMQQLWNGDDHINASVYLITHGFSDPVLVGIKGEPRPIVNGIKKKPRLICQVSVNMNLVARLVLGNHLIEEQRHEDIPTATQLDIITPEITEKFRLRLEKLGGEVSSNDVQGWEYSVTESDRWAACFKQAQCMGLIDADMKPRPGKYRHLYVLFGYTFCMIHRVVQLPEGKLVVTKPGEMSSGELATFSDNSFMRAYLSECVSIMNTGKGVDFVTTAGDDCLDTNARADASYLSFGKVITDFKTNKGTYDFCSTTFAPGGSYQNNIEKSFYATLINNSFKQDEERNFISAFKLHPRFEELYGFLCETYHPGN